MMSYPRKHAKLSLKLISALTIAVIAVCTLSFFMAPKPSLNPFYTNLAAQCKTCPIAKQLARDDFNKEKYLIIAWGLIDSESPTLRIARTLEKDYKIKTVFGGCVRQDEIECYDSQMRKLLVSKYGNTFYKNAYREAITLSDNDFN